MTNFSLAKEKRSHVPGQKYYQETSIRPEYGEGWLCTEAEAIANRWQKSKKRSRKRPSESSMRELQDFKTLKKQRDYD